MRTEVDQFLTNDWVTVLIKGGLFAVKVIGYETPDRMLVQRVSTDTGKIGIFMIDPADCALLWYEGMTEDHLVYSDEEKKKW